MSDRDSLESRVRRGFEEAFGAPPTHAAWAPGRVNLIGEHTDYNAGLALPIAIDRGCVAVGRVRAAGDRFAALDVGGRFDGKGDRPGWASYVAGVTMLMRDRLGVGDDVGFEVAFGSTVPVGAGLSSSAALEVSVATLVESLVGEGLESLEKARLCQRAEHEYAGVACGLMDQLVAIGAEAGRAMLIDFKDDTWTQVPAPPAGSLLVVDSGVRHALASSEYGARRRVCEAACEALGVKSLRELTMLEARDRRLDHEQVRCVRHVVTEIERTRLAATALKIGGLEELGQLMTESHRSLRDDYRVSCEALDAIVDAAVSSDGVYGARMTGGGFGGCAIVLGEEEAIARIAAEGLARERARFVVTASNGASAI